WGGRMKTMGAAGAWCTRPKVGICPHAAAVILLVLAAGLVWCQLEPVTVEAAAITPRVAAGPPSILRRCPEGWASAMYVPSEEEMAGLAFVPIPYVAAFS